MGNDLVVLRECEGKRQSKDTKPLLRQVVDRPISRPQYVRAFQEILKLSPYATFAQKTNGNLRCDGIIKAIQQYGNNQTGRYRLDGKLHIADKLEARVRVREDHLLT